MLTNAISTDDVNSFIIDVNNFVNKYVDQDEVPEDVLYRFEKVDTQLQKFMADPTISAGQKERLMQLGNGLRAVLTSNIFKDRELQEQEYLRQMKEARTAELKEVAEMRKVEDIVQMHEDLLKNASLGTDPTYKKMRDEHLAELKEYEKVAKGVEKSIVKEMLNELLTKPKSPPVPVEEKMPSPTEESMASAVSEMTIEPAESKEPEYMPAVRDEYAKVEQKFTDVVNLFEDLESKTIGTSGNRLNRYSALTNLMDRLGVPDADMANIWESITSMKTTKARHNKIVEILENTELDKTKYDKLRGQEKVMFKNREFAKTKLVDLIVKYLNVK